MAIRSDIYDRILILDGAMGTMIQKFGLGEKDYHAGPFSACKKELSGNNECLNITRPDVIKSIHKEYIAAGADIIETNTFSANRISQDEYGCSDHVYAMAYEGAKIAREAADEAAEEAAEKGISRKVFVAGSIGPTSKSLSLSQDAADPGFRPYSFDNMTEAYCEQVEALVKGGADILLIETCFDALNVKAVLTAIQKCIGDSIPVMISVSVSDRSGRTLTGQTLEAFFTSVKHYPLLSFGLNCSLGAAELTPLIEQMGRWCSCGISCYPNAGLPNGMGGYDQSPEEMAGLIRKMAERGLINIAGGCCGTTPAHIKAISEAMHDIRPRTIDSVNMQDRNCNTGCILKVSGLETVEIDVRNRNFTNVGERTNVAGSRKFARLISEGKYEDALQIAAKQIEDGASVIDINMDDAMLDSTKEMERFVRYISNDPAVAKAALMIDSSHWDTILAGLKNAQGKCIVNSISLKEGTESFLEKARVIKSFGAAVVVMAFDEQGQATTFDRKVEICERAYGLLTREAGFAPEDIIFDANILSIGTGVEEHARYAVDFIEAVRWIKANLPGALTSGGVSNLSFAFRGNNAVREAMHSAFLYHAIKAGLDMAIVNPSMLQIYDEIEPELLKCVEDVIFDTDPQATERLVVKAAGMLADSSTKTNGTSEDAPLAESSSYSAAEILRNAVVKGISADLQGCIPAAVGQFGNAVEIIEGPLMEGMETVGKMFSEGKMFLPQVVKSAKVMRDAVKLLEPYMNDSIRNEDGPTASSRKRIVLATVKGDVHDIGKNITGIVLTCNGFDVHDLGVMVEKETILDTALDIGADMIAVSGLITPSLYQMEEICREMTSRGMDIPLFIGGATTSAVHTAVKLAPLYRHVFYGPDASAAAVMAKKCMMDRNAFEDEQHKEQQRLRELYTAASDEGIGSSEHADIHDTDCRYPACSYPETLPADIPVTELKAEDVLPFFDWKMFYAIWGVKYGSAVPEAMELIQLRRDAEEEIALEDFRIMISARFFPACSDGNDIIMKNDGKEKRLPMMRQESGKEMSLSDFVIPDSLQKVSPVGMFAVSVHKKSKAHIHGCSCPACSSQYEDMIGSAVRMTLAEAASSWLDQSLKSDPALSCNSEYRIIKPAAGYSSCPDHTLKEDILHLLEENAADQDRGAALGIEFTESYAMKPESSICGMIFIHPQACYPEIRRISRRQYDEYASRRGMDAETARRFLGHLLK